MEAKQRQEIGERLRGLRNHSPQTNRSIADYVGVGERSVGNWMAGDTGMTWDNARKVAELFDVSVHWLWDGEEREAETPDVLAQLNPNGSAGEMAQMRAEVERLLSELDAARLEVLEAISEVHGELAEIRRLVAPASRGRAKKSS
jgi:transcriptional regulator with XRE-family HTH domain